MTNAPDYAHTYINGTIYRIFDVERDGTLVVCRPNGSKFYRARRLPDSPLYGEMRSKIVGAWTESPTD